LFKTKRSTLIKTKMLNLDVFKSSIVKSIHLILQI
jgi:hypothetical protein